MNKPSDASLDVAWLHYVGGLTQAEIAKRRGLSKATVHRLLRAAHENGAVRVFIGERPNAVVDLEQEMISAFGLRTCRLAPPALTDPASVLEGVASLAVQSLMARLEQKKDSVIGLGAGRTLGAMARAFPTVRIPEAEFVSLTGDFSVFRIGHSTDVLRRLSDRTGGTGYSIAAPILADTEADRETMISQKGTRIAFRKISESQCTFLGVGDMNDGSFLTAFNLVTPDELSALREIGVAADLCGTLVDVDGQPVDCEIARRMLACGLQELEGKHNTAVAFGIDKVAAIGAALKSGLISELISDFATSKQLIAENG